MKSILVTGGTGFLAEELLTRLDTSDVRIVARNEGKLIEVKNKYPDIEIMPGDLGDECIARKACDGIDTCYHLAAFKHVGMAETDTWQCIKSNVTATENVLNHFWGHLFVAISTDKAAQVSGVYGATKLLMEKLIQEQVTYKNSRFRQYRIVRYGNVLYSTGSVLCKWKELLQQGKDVTITDPDATRFFWTREQAVDHIFECIENSEDATPYIPQMKAMRVGDLLEAMMQKYAVNRDTSRIRVIGLQPGENLHETMDGKVFSNQVEQYTIDEIMELI